MVAHPFLLSLNPVLFPLGGIPNIDKLAATPRGKVHMLYPESWPGCIQFLLLAGPGPPLGRW